MFFGVLVSCIDLVAAARAWPRRKVLSIVFASFIRARAQGRLIILEHVAPVLLRVPPEIWTLIEAYAAAALFDDEERNLVKSLHMSGAERTQCKCTVCARDAHLTLIEHDMPTLEWSCLDWCGKCHDGLVDANGTQGVMEDQTDVRPFLHQLKTVYMLRS